MFFNKGKKVAGEIKPMVERTLKSMFVGTKYLDQASGAFYPPFTFYEDPYIRGFVTGASEHLSRAMFDSRAWSSSTRGNFWITLWVLMLGGLEGETVARELSKTLLEGAIRQPVFFRGYDAGRLAILSGLGLVESNESDPIWMEAQALAPELHEELLASGTGSKSSSVTLSLAVANLTLRHHIQSNYLS
jgi:hypothetical protein